MDVSSLVMVSVLCSALWMTGLLTGVFVAQKEKQMFVSKCCTAISVLMISLVAAMDAFAMEWSAPRELEPSDSTKRRRRRLALRLHYESTSPSAETLDVMQQQQRSVKSSSKQQPAESPSTLAKEGIVFSDQQLLLMLAAITPSCTMQPCGQQMGTAVPCSEDCWHDMVYVGSELSACEKEGVVVSCGLPCLQQLAAAPQQLGEGDIACEKKGEVASSKLHCMQQELVMGKAREVVPEVRVQGMPVTTPLTTQCLKAEGGAAMLLPGGAVSALSTLPSHLMSSHALQTMSSHAWQRLPVDGSKCIGTLPVDCIVPAVVGLVPEMKAEGPRSGSPSAFGFGRSNSSASAAPCRGDAAPSEQVVAEGPCLEALALAADTAEGLSKYLAASQRRDAFNATRWAESSRRFAGPTQSSTESGVSRA